MENEWAALEAKLAAQVEAAVEAKFAARATELARVEGRLARVERKARAFVAGATVLALGGLSLLFTGPGQTQPQPQGAVGGSSGASVRAPFRVIGSGNRTLLAVSDQGGVIINDSQGRGLLRVASVAGARGTQFLDGAGELVAFIGQEDLPEGETVRGLQVGDSDGDLAASLVSFTNEFGEAHALSIWDENEIPQVTVGLDLNDGFAGLNILKGDGTFDDILRLGRGGANTGLSILNQAGQQEVLLQATPANGEITLRNSAGTVIFQQP